MSNDHSEEQLPPSSPREKQPSLSTADAIAVFIGMVVLACLAMLLLCVVAVGLIGLFPSRRPPAYSVSMDGFSGLAVDANLPREFNLTMGIDNLGGTVEVCVGGEAADLYRGVPLAGGHVEDLCVPRKHAADLSIVTASGGVAPCTYASVTWQKRSCVTHQFRIAKFSLLYQGRLTEYRAQSF